MCNYCVDGIISHYRVVGRRWVCIGTEPCPDKARGMESGPSLCQYCYKSPPMEGSSFCSEDCHLKAHRPYAVHSPLIKVVKFAAPETGWKHMESVSQVVGKYRVVVMVLFGVLTHSIKLIDSPHSHKRSS